MSSKQRESIKFEAEFSGGLEGWTMKFIKANFWRFAAHYEFEDLVQEAWIKFLYVKEKYPRVVEPEHFMSLYKTSLRNHFHDLAFAYKGEKDLICLAVDSDEEYSDILNGLPGGEPNNGMLNIILSEAPREVRELVRVLCTDASRFCQSKKRRNSSGRETTNEFLCRVMGYNPEKVNLRKMVQDCLSTEGEDAGHVYYEAG